MKTESFQNLAETLGRAAYTPLIPLRIEVWRSREPLSFAERRSGEYAECELGDIWGEACFDCAWMRFSADRPKCDGPLFARIDVNGEMCVVDSRGLPLRGLTNKKSEFARALGSPAKIICPLDPSHERNGRVEIWADAAFNDLFGRVQSQGRIEVAELVSLREEVLALHYDVELCADYVVHAYKGDGVADKIQHLLQEVFEIVDGGEQLTDEAVSKARKTLRPVFDRPVNTDFRISAIGHAHLDLAWLWPIRESKRKGARTFATALANLEKYPNYVFGCSQPQLFAWMEESYPELFKKVKNAISEGRIELLGTFWVEPDCNIPNGESLVRQVLYGRRYFEQTFGIVPKQCWQPDVFGYNGQLPQILLKSGHDAFMTQKLSWNSVNRFPHHTFEWEGIDGSRLPAHCLPEETYNGPASAASVLKICEEYEERDLSRNALMVYGIGDGGGGPGEAHLERLERLASFCGLPPVVQEPSSKFFPRWLEEAAAFPKWQGELYLERHQGTFTTIAAVKRYNRRCEIALRELEILASLAEIRGSTTYPTEELDRIWKEVLLYQFHDILPGSSIKRVYDECLPRYEELLREIESLSCQVVDALTQLSPDAGAEVVAFNSLGWPRREWLSRDGHWYRVEVPAFGWGRLAENEKKDEYVPPSISERHLENEHLRVELNIDGTLSSIVDKTTGAEILPENASANAFQIIADEGDAWDFVVDPETKNVAAYLERPAARPELVKASISRDGPKSELYQFFRFRESTIHLRISLEADSPLLRFDAEVDWQESGHLLRVIFPTSIRAESARYEIPFGSIRRVTHEGDPVAQAQFEVPAQQWVDLSEPGLGIALVNDCKYGFRIKDGCIGMSLIRSVPYPNEALVEATDSSDLSAPVNGDSSDLGRHIFSYALGPHDGSLSEGELTKIARSFNQPLRFARCQKHFDLEGFLALDSDQLEVVALKKSELGQGYILRLVNLRSEPVQSVLQFNFPVSDLQEVDLVERAMKRPLEFSGGELDLKFAPFEIRSFVFSGNA